MTINWSFVSSGDTGREGISDSGIEFFRAKPVTALARESVQNSLDAGVSDKPVRLEFNLYELPVEKFPDLETFKRILGKCEQSWNNGNYEKTMDFLKEAKRVVNEPTITFMRVSDFNTTGLKGSNKKADADWPNLVKARGVSEKSGTAGGSFGIGKFATFACSSLRTVFYSTLDIDGLTASQGVAKLVSFNLSDKDNIVDYSLATGFLGKEGMMPENYCKSYDPSFTRKEPGTDIYIAGYKKEFNVNWDKIIVKEVIENYLYAIHQGTLEIVVNGELVSKATLSSIMSKYSDRLSENTKCYYQVLISDQTKWYEEDFMGQGSVSLGLLLMDKNAPKKVALIRKPWMKIKEQDKINDFIPFAGMFIIKGDELNKFLRTLENPEHNKWDPNLAKNQNDRELATIIIKNIRVFIAERINNLVKDDNVEKLDIEGAADLLPLDEQEDAGTGADIDTLTPRVSSISVKKQQRIRSSMKAGEGDKVEIQETESGEITPKGEETKVAPHGNGASHSGDSSGDESRGFGEGDNPVSKSKLVSTSLLKFMCINRKMNQYRILFTPEFSADNCTFSIFRVDEQGERSPVKISSAISGTVTYSVTGNRVVNVEVTKDQLSKIDFTVDIDDYFSAEVQIHGNQK